MSQLLPCRSIQVCVHLDDEVVVREGILLTTWWRLSPLYPFYTCIFWKSKKHNDNTTNGERIKISFLRIAELSENTVAASRATVSKDSHIHLYDDTISDSLLVLDLAWFD